MYHIYSGKLSKSKLIPYLCYTNAHMPRTISRDLLSPLSPAFDQPSEVKHFSPVSNDLYDSNSVLLAMNKITPYLDKALHALGLHTEAQTPFITYVNHL